MCSYFFADDEEDDDDLANGSAHQHHVCNDSDSSLDEHSSGDERVNCGRKRKFAELHSKSEKITHERARAVRLLGVVCLMSFITVCCMYRH